MSADPAVQEHEVDPVLYRSGRAKRWRSNQIRVATYVISVAVVVFVIATADWPKLHRTFFDLNRAKAQFPDIIYIAAKNTLLLTVLSYSIGLAIGLAITLLRLAPVRAYRWFAATYIEIFRGLPAILTILLVGYTLPIALKVSFPTVLGLDGAGVFALALVAGAYMAETIRSGIEAVPKGQAEAARSLGMTARQTMGRIVIPQAFRIIIPPLTNELILLLKDTALVGLVMGSTTQSKELLKFGQDAAADFNGTPLMLAGFLYLVITFPLTRLVAQLEKRTKAAR
ncbi:MAG: putative transporter permease protein [Acidimicrobiales bacterium]|nr:putative transporter permease protein [Acidimicrobiales bacterium]